MNNFISDEKGNTIVEGIVLNVDSERIIFFGSYAGETPNQYRDLDLIVVKDMDMLRPYRAREAKQATMI